MISMMNNQQNKNSPSTKEKIPHQKTPTQESENCGQIDSGQPQDLQERIKLSIWT
jgi:hypothetical protein